MKVWRLITSSGCPTLTNENEAEEILMFNGVYIDNFNPVKVYTLRKRKAKTDAYYYLQSIPIVNVSTKRLLEPLLGDRVQFCELIHEDDLWAINVINVIDCLDKERSVYDNFSPGKVGYIYELFLKDQELRDDSLIFKIPEQLTTDVYVTQPFIDFVEQHKIKGFEFIEAWDSEYTVEKQQEIKQRYEERIAEINQQLDANLDWEAINPCIEQGRAFISDVYKLQYNAKGELMLGHLQLDLTYDWSIPIYLPPNILEYKWCETEPEKL